MRLLLSLQQQQQQVKCMTIKLIIFFIKKYFKKFIEAVIRDKLNVNGANKKKAKNIFLLIKFVNKNYRVLIDKHDDDVNDSV